MAPTMNCVEKPCAGYPGLPAHRTCNMRLEGGPLSDARFAGVDKPAHGSEQTYCSSEGDSGGGSIEGFGLPTVLSAESPWRNWLQEQESESLPNQPPAQQTAHDPHTAAVPGASAGAQSNSAVGAVQSDAGCGGDVGVSLSGASADIAACMPRTKTEAGPVCEGIEESDGHQAGDQPMEPPTGNVQHCNAPSKETTVSES